MKLFMLFSLLATVTIPALALDSTQRTPFFETECELVKIGPSLQGQPKNYITAYLNNCEVLAYSDGFNSAYVESHVLYFAADPEEVPQHGHVKNYLSLLRSAQFTGKLKIRVELLRYNTSGGMTERWFVTRVASDRSGLVFNFPQSQRLDSI